jgi:hypothetical protein
MKPYKIYSTLDLTEKMPHYPFSFPEAALACWFPSLWFKAIDPLVDRVMNG